MDFKVVFKDAFCDDLEQIVRDIAAENPDAARRLGKLIIRSAESLTVFPECYPRVRGFQGMRRLIVKKHYKVFYRVLPDHPVVEVLRCRDVRRGTNPGI